MAVDGSQAIRIEGLNEFRRGLTRANRDVGKKIGQANKRLGERVVQGARVRYAQNYTVRSGRTQRSLRASASQSRVQVKLGGPKAPWALGQEFGSDRYRQFSPWAGKAPGGKGGHGKFLYPEIREQMDGIRTDYLDILDEATREAFPNG